jgi:hypothetical protein
MIRSTDYKGNLTDGKDIRLVLAESDEEAFTKYVNFWKNETGTIVYNVEVLEPIE